MVDIERFIPQIIQLGKGFPKELLTNDSRGNKIALFPDRISRLFDLA